ncbi:hypothetical protein BD560DRAFT_428995 [Blakeslea trispora]|nr:hypothetical protein BD560DRAFT_428995 [Blakeslea trispora]
MNNCSRSFSPEHQLTVATCFALPIKAALTPASSSSFRFSTYWKQATINSFFAVDSTNMKIVYRSNQDCPFPSILNKIRWAVATGEVSLHPSIVHHMQHSSNCEAPVDLQPVIDSLQYNDIPLMNLKRKQFRRMILSNLLPETSSSPIPHISASQWQAFVDAPMQSNVRNVWYRLIHRQLSSRARLFPLLRDVEDDRCRVCHDIESDEHMLFTCSSKLSVWSSSFQRYFNNPFMEGQIYVQLSTLQLNLFNIRSPDRVSIYDILGSILQSIWRAHWNEVFNSVAFVEGSVLNAAHKKILRSKAFLELK